MMIQEDDSDDHLSVHRWDGICDGVRGWFPGNFVTNPEQMELPLDEVLTFSLVHSRIILTVTAYYVGGLGGNLIITSHRAWAGPEENIETINMT
jgi:hypothetical protein